MSSISREWNSARRGPRRPPSEPPPETRIAPAKPALERWLLRCAPAIPRPRSAAELGYSRGRASRARFGRRRQEVDHGEDGYHPLGSSVGGRAHALRLLRSAPVRRRILRAPAVPGHHGPDRARRCPRPRHRLARRAALQPRLLHPRRPAHGPGRRRPARAPHPPGHRGDAAPAAQPGEDRRASRHRRPAQRRAPGARGRARHRADSLRRVRHPAGGEPGALRGGARLHPGGVDPRDLLLRGEVLPRAGSHHRAPARAGSASTGPHRRQ